MQYIKKVEIRWSDLDPNFHLKHSSYYDFGAYCRVSFLYDNGITAAFMKQHEIGPILLKEECIFKREIVFGDEVSVSLKLKSISKDFRKFTMLHEIYKAENEPAAILTIYGAWLNTTIRKITVPPQLVIDSVDKMDKTEDFTLT